MDDVIVGSGNKKDHILDLRCIFKKVKDSALFLNKNKCVLGLSSIKFLGQIVKSHGISIQTDPGDDIKRFPPPNRRKNWSISLVPSFTLPCLMHPEKWHH